jgi:hypothetical protein
MTKINQKVKMNNKPDRRDFDRFPIAFLMEVAATDNKGNKYKEKTVLKNISGEGAKFITKQTGKYFPGQSLELTIYLPGSAEVKARMSAKATVMRLDPLSNSKIDGRSQMISIAIKLDTPLHFARDDGDIQGRNE